MSERWLFVRWQSVFVKQPSNDNVAWWLWYVLLRNMPWWWGGCSDDVLYLWLNDCCRCSVKLLWMELIVVFSTMLLSNYFCLLLVWVGMEMVDGIVLMWADMVVCSGEWWRRGGIEDVRCRVLFPHDVGWCRCTWGWLSCYHAATSRWWYGRMFVAVSSYLMMWRRDVVVDGIVWCADMVVVFGGDVAVVVEVGVCAALPSWWFMMMLIQHGVDCCDCWLQRWEYLITEELNFVGKRAKEEGNIVPVACCGLPPRWCDFIGARITSADHI